MKDDKISILNELNKIKSRVKKIEKSNELQNTSSALVVGIQTLDFFIDDLINIVR